MEKSSTYFWIWFVEIALLLNTIVDFSFEKMVYGIAAFCGGFCYCYMLAAKEIEKEFKDK